MNDWNCQLKSNSLFIYHKLFFQACFHNYSVSLQRWKVIYSTAIKLPPTQIFFSFLCLKFFFSQKCHFFEKRNHLFSLIFCGTVFGRVCDITSVPHFFHLEIRPSVRRREEKLCNSRTHISLESYFLFLQLQPKEETSVELVLSMYFKLKSEGFFSLTTGTHFIKYLKVLSKKGTMLG